MYTSEDASSTGGAITVSTIASNVKNNLWPDVSNSDRILGGVMHRKVFFKNNNATDALAKPVIYTPTLPTNMTLSIGLGFNHSDDDDANEGNMTAWTANAKVALISDGTDVRTATIYGLDNSGTPAPVTENVVLTNAVEVLSSNTYSKVWAIFLSALDGSRIVTVKQGSGGTTRGTIGQSKKGCFLWVVGPSTKGSGIALPDLAAGQDYGLWERLAWSAGASVARPNNIVVNIEEMDWCLRESTYRCCMAVVSSCREMLG